MLLFLGLLACSGGDDTAAAEAPTVSWLEPADAGSVTAGTVACSLVVEHFTLEDPAMHSEGGAEGYVAVSVDGTVVTETSQTTFDVELAAGAHTLDAQLFYVDGDEVRVADGALCEEDGEGCEPALASITVTAE